MRLLNDHHLRMTTLNKLIYFYITNKLINKRNTIKLTNTIKLDNFVKVIVGKKKDELHHQSDPFNEASRWRTGIGGEIALEKFLGKSFVDLSLGESIDYHVSDLSKLGLNVGIKTVKHGKYPIIFKESERPEIIILRLDDETFSILGLASIDVLNKYQDKSEIVSPYLKSRGTKTAFTGLHKLKQFSDYNQLINLLN